MALLISLHFTCSGTRMLFCMTDAGWNGEPETIYRSRLVQRRRDSDSLDERRKCLPIGAGARANEVPAAPIHEPLGVRAHGL
jgi:hypothetical protein